MEDLEEAIHKAQQAVDITKGHPDLAGPLLNDFCLSSQQTYCDQALECFLKSWSHPNRIPFHRVASAFQAIRLLKQRANWSEHLQSQNRQCVFFPW